MEEKIIIHRSDVITELMEKMIPELRAHKHGFAVPCIALAPCGAEIYPVWAIEIEGKGFGVFMPQHEKRYFFDTDLVYIECEEDDTFFYENVKCEVVRLDHRLALRFVVIN